MADTRMEIRGGRMDGVMPRWTQDPNKLDQGIFGEQYSDIATFAFTAANASQVVTRPVLQDSDYMLQKLCFKATSSDFHIMIEDTSTGKSLFSGPLPAVAVLGTAQEPFEFVCPYIFRNNGSIKITVQNGGTAVNLIEIVMHGARLYKLTRG